jgi:hypothetical protein
LKEYVSKIKNLKDNINIDLDGDIADIIQDPKTWAESIAEVMIAQNAEKLIQARKLGEEFAKTINED